MQICFSHAVWNKKKITNLNKLFRWTSIGNVELQYGNENVTCHEKNVMSDIGVVYTICFHSLDTLISTLRILLSRRLKASIMIPIKVPEGDRVLDAVRVFIWVPYLMNMRLPHYSIFTVLLIDDPVNFSPQDRSHRWFRAQNPIKIDWTFF